MKNNKETVTFKVAPYALYDVLRALEVEAQQDIYTHFEKGVTKEDNDLVVWVTKEHLPKPSNDCCADPSDEVKENE